VKCVLHSKALSKITPNPYHCCDLREVNPFLRQFCRAHLGERGLFPAC